MPSEKSFDLPETNVEEINKIIRSLNTCKATGPDCILAKILKLSANVIDNHLYNITNNDIFQNWFSENAKSPSVRPIFKKDDRTKIKTIDQKVSLIHFQKFMNNTSLKT